MKLTKRVKFVVSKRCHYYDGRYHPGEWSIFRQEELGGGLIATRKVAHIFAPRDFAERTALAMTKAENRGTQ